MSSFRLILASLLHHWRTNCAVACGVAVGTAVLAGALLVGDSMRGSLRHLTLDRLGRIDEVLVADRFFRTELADELGRQPGFQERFSAAAPAIILRASLEWIPSEPGTVPVFAGTMRSMVARTGLSPSAEHGQDGRGTQTPGDTGVPPVLPVARASRVNLIGCDERFWAMGPGGPQQPPQGRQIVLNRPLAEQLCAQVGDELLCVTAGKEIMLRLPEITAVPAESLLGRKKKEETLRGLPLVVSEIIPAEGLGRFGLRPTQQLPQNAYVSLEILQRALRQPGRVNAILVAGRGDTPRAADHEALQQMLHPTAADYGLSVAETPLGYINITCDRMLIDPAAEKGILEALLGSCRNSAPKVIPSRAVPARPGSERERVIAPSEDNEVQPALTYLANTIACGDKEIPYSTITAIDFAAEPPLGPLKMASPGRKPGDDSRDRHDRPPSSPGLRPGLARGEIVLNTWAAKELDAHVGDTIRVSYFEPASTHGAAVETTVEFCLLAICELSGAAADRDLTPEVPGVTDRRSMRDWKAPFPFKDGRILPRDDRYWKDFGPTPKAFVSLAEGRRLWGSRFGQTTSIRVRPTAEITAESLREKLALDPTAMGFVFQPVKQQGLAAAVGTTPFNLLFLGFSSFIIAAAVMLVALLFRLGIERRAAQIGILLAVGVSRRKVGRLLAAEGLLVAAAGSLLGMAAGVGYAALMLLGLRTWWLGAVVTPFLRLYVTWESLAIGYASGLLVAFAAIAFSVWRIGRIAPRRLLAGQASEEGRLSLRESSAAFAERKATRRRLVVVLLTIAPVVALLLAPIRDDFRAGAFFGGGAFVLAVWLVFARLELRGGGGQVAIRAGRGNLARLAMRNAARNPGRSALCIGLVAAASFLIVALSAFRLDPTQQVPTLDSGNGGFALVAESDQPIYQNLDTPEGRKDAGLTDAESLPAGVSIFALRVKPGDDASCLNLYQPRQPRVLGLPPRFCDRGGSAWVAAPKDCENSWLLLEEQFPPDDDGVPRVPVILEQNTANYSLHLWKGPGETFDIADSHGRPLRLVVVALLANSIFQGDLLISERQFLAHFPEVGGYRFFLVECPAETTAEKTDEIAAALRSGLGDYGLTIETTGQRLAGFLAVQNTYLSTFQSLGGLGLLLGTVGLAAVQVRSVLERRGELALLRAAGFRRRRLAALVLIENALLLLAGLAIGVLAAGVAVLPHLLHRTASIPWQSLGLTLALVLLVGLLAALSAVRFVLRAPLLAALREER